MLLLFSFFSSIGLLQCVTPVLTSSYANEWAVDIPGGAEVAQAVAMDLGYDFLGQVSSHQIYYLYTSHLCIETREKRMILSVD